MSDGNPFAPPIEEQGEPSSRIATDGPLFSPGQIAGASFLGSPIAGVFLMVANHRRLRQNDRLVATLGTGALIVGLTFVLAFLLPEQVPGIVVGAAYTGAMYAWANTTFGEAYQAYVAAGGEPAGLLPTLAAALLGLFLAVAIIVVLIVSGMALTGEI